ncbi:hypothetical protein [Thermoflexus sp.]
MGEPFLGLIGLTQNTCDRVVQCLAGLYKGALSWGWQLIVVDNGPTD